RAASYRETTTRAARPRLGALTSALYLLQPLARLRGRLRSGLTPSRARNVFGLVWPVPRTVSHWSESWRSVEDRLAAIEQYLLVRGVHCRRGSDFDRWDLEVRAGPLSSARLRIALEEHGAGK